MSRSSSRAVLLVTLLTFALALAACGSSAGTAAPTATAAAASAPASAAAPSSAGGGGGGSAVTIKDFAFGPASLEVAAGTTVTWTNQDSTGHTATADDGSFDSSTIASGQTFSQAFPTAGTFAYHCSIHSNMKATIVVK